MDAFFKELGRTVLKRWKQENFFLAKFPQIDTHVYSLYGLTPEETALFQAPAK